MTVPLDLTGLTLAEQERLTLLLQEEIRDQSRKKFYSRFPDTGPLRRDLYPKHMELFTAGLLYRERAFMAANRVGKTDGGGYEATCHLTGLYPDWWGGKRFDDGPIEAWAAGKTNETTRDIVQAAMFGKVEWIGSDRGFTGTGMVPGDLVAKAGDISWRTGVADLADVVKIQHHDRNKKPDGWSILGLKSYQQGRGSFEGTAKHLIWLDEEPPPDIYGECLIRTATTGGIILTTFTPLDGMTDVALSFMPAEMRPGA